MPKAGIQQFRAPSSEGCFSYIVYDRVARLAAVIDPRVDRMDDYREFLSALNLKPLIVLDTHTQADHFSATHLLRDAFHCEIGMSHRTESGRVTRKLRQGDRLELGSWALTVLEVPGQTPDSLAFHGDGMVFTGDTLLIGGTGRTDLPGSDASVLWDSLHRVLGALPGSTLVFPAHDFNDLIFSTIEVESKNNPAWLKPNLDAFLAFKKAEAQFSGVSAGISDEVRARLRYNLEAAPGLPPHGFSAAFVGGSAAEASMRGTAPASIGVAKYSQKLKEHQAGHFFVDVREGSEFAAGHMPGVSNIPLSELGQHLDELKAAKRVYLSCLSGRRSSWAAKTLSYVGLTDVVNVTGGYQAWQMAEFPTQKP
jgi:glyoxylase-like metal-dependent hydrolase (beta-lactamase superfamily II)/rhodanese-related sulfurtransferase